jgi:hypothetical protein
MLWSAMTGPFGEYRIDEIPAGNTYFMNVSHKRYSFGSRVINVEDNIAGLDFTAE